jgi:hypothetical protein
MGQMQVGVDNAASSPIYVTQAAPIGTKFYFHSIVEAPGVVAANNFLSIFNPIGSGKTLIFYAANIDAYSTAGTSVTNNLQIFRTTAASAGTLITASAVNRFVTTDPNPVAQVRVGNPTVTTTGTVLIGFPPAITGAGAGTGPVGNASIPPGAGFICLPGEGVSYGTAVGSTAQLWNLNVTWAEA